MQTSPHSSSHILSLAPRAWLPLGLIAAGLAVLTACGGGGDGHDHHGEEHHGEANAPADEEMVPVEGIPMSCPEGTRHQQAETSKGVEHWCDRNGTMHGPFLRLHKNGKKQTSGAYLNNLPDGPWIWWHASGKESEKGKYVKGKQTGSWTKWYESGAREEEGDYLQGRKQGTWTKWFESGAKMESGIYHNGMKSSLWTYYLDDEENTPDRTERFENGQVVEEKKLKKK